MRSHMISVSALCLGLLAFGPLGGIARADEQARQSSTPDPVERLGAITQPLLDSANYWRAHGRPAVALSQLERILSYSPDDLAILATAAEVALEAQDYGKAAKYRTRFSQAASAIPRPPAAVVTPPEKQAEPEKAKLADAAPFSVPLSLPVPNVITRSEKTEAAAPIAQSAPALENRTDLLKASVEPAREQTSTAMNDETRVSVLNAMGCYAEAEQLLLRLSHGRETASTYVQLGAIQFRAGKLNGAEESFGRARSMAPDNADAASGLAHVRTSQAQWNAATALYADAAGLYTRANNSVGLRSVEVGRAELLRARTAGMDAVDAGKVYEEGLAADPGNMTARLDYARLLQKAGLGQQAWSIVTRGVELNHNDRESVRLAIDFATQSGDRQHAAELIQSVKE